MLCQWFQKSCASSLLLLVVYCAFTKSNLAFTTTNSQHTCRGFVAALVDNRAIRTWQRWRTPTEYKKFDQAKYDSAFHKYSNDPKTAKERVPETYEEKLALIFYLGQKVHSTLLMDILSSPRVSDRRAVAFLLRQLDFKTGMTRRKAEKLIYELYLLRYRDLISIRSLHALGQDETIQRMIMNQFEEALTTKSLTAALEDLGLLCSEGIRDRLKTFLKSRTKKLGGAMTILLNLPMFALNTGIPFYIPNYKTLREKVWGTKDISEILLNGSLEDAYPQLKREFGTYAKFDLYWGLMRKAWAMILTAQTAIFINQEYQAYLDEEEEKEKFKEAVFKKVDGIAKSTTDKTVDDMHQHLVDQLMSKTDPDDPKVKKVMELIGKAYNDSKSPVPP